MKPGAQLHKTLRPRQKETKKLREKETKTNKYNYCG